MLPSAEASTLGTSESPCTPPGRHRPKPSQAPNPGSSILISHIVHLLSIPITAVLVLPPLTVFSELIHRS